MSHQAVGVIAYKTVMRMHSQKICKFQCLVSRDECFVENWKMSHFFRIDTAFIQMLFKSIVGYVKNRLKLL